MAFSIPGIRVSELPASRRERALQNLKGARTTVRSGTPRKEEGAVGDMTLRSTAEGLVLFVKSVDKWNDVNKLQPKVPIPRIITFPNVDATPNVTGATVFKSGGSTETITTFKNGIIGQTITIVSQAAITYDFNANNLKCGSADIVTASGDTTTWIYDGSNWYLLSWMDVSANLADGSAGGF